MALFTAIADADFLEAAGLQDRTVERAQGLDSRADRDIAAQLFD